MKITLVRHGETDFNKQKLFQGTIDKELNVTGKIQARNVGSYLFKMGYNFNAVYASPLKRAFNTAEIIVNELNINSNIIKKDGLIERDFGIYCGKPYNAELVKKILNNESSEYESNKNLELRVRNCLNEICNENDFNNHILIVCHSHTIKGILASIDNTFDYTKFLVNCSINNLEYSNGILKIKEINISASNI